MKKNTFTILFCFIVIELISLQACYSRQIYNGPTDGRIRFIGTLPAEYNQKEIQFTLFPVYSVCVYNRYSDDKKITLREKVIDGKVGFNLPSNQPMYIWGSFLKSFNIDRGHRSNQPFFIEPDETLEVTLQNGKPVFHGRTAPRFELSYKIGLAFDSLNKAYVAKGLSSLYVSIPFDSLKDFILWNELANEKLTIIDQLLSAYQNKISSYALNIIKEGAYGLVEDDRSLKFDELFRKVDLKDWTKHELGLSNKDLCIIYDTTMNSHAAKWLRYECPLVRDPYYLYRMIKLDTYRNQNKFYPEKTGEKFLVGEEKEDDYVLRYNLAKLKYSGVRRDQVLAFMFYQAGFLDHGFNSKIESILADFYSLKVSDPDFHQVVKDYEAKKRNSYRKVSPMNDFSLTDVNGKPFTLDHLKGKVAVFDFWFTGCSGCVQMVPAIAKIEGHFKNNKEVVFVSVSVDEDKEKWLKSIEKGKYTSRSSTHAYTNGKGDEHSIIKDYEITGYPTLLFLDAFGKVMRVPRKSDPRTDEGKSLTAMIEKELVRMKDGPYVFEENGRKTAYTVNGAEFTQSAGNLIVQSDQVGKTFTVPLQKELVIQPSISERPEKLIALSDIEGNFDKFRMLLQNNKIIGEDYNWTFGNGHLVFAGDMFDRGEQVTECLWLIYSLEEKAKAAGGYVHFILGNHEIMNLQGNFKYVQDKYKTSAKTLAKTLMQLYAENTELGKWLRTKNIAEQIGDLLFAHGGFSSKINQSDLTIQDINKLARPYYDNNMGEGKYPDANTNMVMSASFGPFWYRGYYPDEDKRHLVQPIVDSILQKYNANHIITGHTIVSDKITTWYDNKVINTDTKHKEGKSEALLIEGGKFYRVNDKGQRWLLFDDGGHRDH